MIKLAQGQLRCLSLGKSIARWFRGNITDATVEIHPMRAKLSTRTSKRKYITIPVFSLNL